jgi:hypothetical protein
MLRTSRALAQATPLVTRRLFAQASSVRSPRQGRTGVLAVAAIATAGGLWYATHEVIHNDAVAEAQLSPAALKPPANVSGVSPADGSLATIVWGSNRRVYTVVHTLLNYLYGL